jgi:hypothetical protein
MASHFRPPPFHSERSTLIAPVRVDPTGRTGPTESQALGSQWRRTSRGLYVPADVDPGGVEQRIVEAAALIPRGGGAVTGWAALCWLGGRWFDGRTPLGRPLSVELAMWSDLRPQDGVRVCKERLNPGEVMYVDGLPVTVPVRSVCFAMRYAENVRDAVRIFDMAAYNDLVSLAEARAYGGMAPRIGLSGWTGIPQFRKALALADENAWSPQEVAMRLVWTEDAELPRPRTNAPIFDRRGNHIATPDLFDEEAGVAAEFDGPHHLDRRQRARDVRREEALRNVGLEYLTMLGGDSANRLELVRRMIETRRRALWLPESERAWTLNPPPWWVSTSTVAERRRLTADQRRRLLRNRAA